MRPDVLIIRRGKRKRDDKSDEREHEESPHRHAHLVEVGYTQELRYLQKLTEKHEQHEQLRQALETCGYKVHRHTIIIGSTGCIFKSSTADIESLGVYLRKLEPVQASQPKAQRAQS